MEYIKYKGYQLDKYIATEYCYSDYFRNKNKNSIYSNFTEGLYHDYFGIDMNDHREENTIKIENWIKNVYENAYENESSIIKDLNGKNHDSYEIKKLGETNKFKRICDLCKIHKDMRVLEVGFGACDFMKYMKETYGIKPVGVSISNEQVKVARSLGFEAHHLDMWKITEQIGKFDLVIQCGSLEYLRCLSESQDKYEKYFKIIKNVLNENGKFFITCLHFNMDDIGRFTMYDSIMGYLLWSGNDGAYPLNKYILSKKAENIGLKTLYQKEYTNDYFISSMFDFSSYGFNDKNKKSAKVSFSGIVDALIKTIAGPYFIHTYLCYSPTESYDNVPFIWQFIPFERKGKYTRYVSLEYILLQR